ncbi:cohesin domain-containing protein [Patescibacteria group bacterium]|nr:cohesin domain-containing protein [Patescibacteria group bacterium]MCL5091978.1 cohesin domain-containing protein [Patescibacteria group bacterium]
MKKAGVKLLLALVLLLMVMPLTTGQVWAATLKFDQTTLSLTVGQTVDVAVVADIGSDQARTVDAYITYDPSILEAQQVTDGTFFPTVSSNITSGKVYIAGLVNDPVTTKTGSGTLATITFKALAAGTGTISVLCQAGASQTSIITKNDLNATNIIECASNGTVAVTVGGGGGSTTTTTPTAYPTITQLPRTGFFDQVVHFSVPGVMLILVGSGLRLLL